MNSALLIVVMVLIGVIGGVVGEVGLTIVERRSIERRNANGGH